VDAQGLKDNFAQVAQHGDAVALFFYSDLFLRNPGLRDMFPIGMSHQRDRLLSALGRIVAQVDNLTDLVPFVRQLGADHRKFGVEALHYPEVGQSLVATLRYFSGAAWNDTLAKDWTDAYTLVAKVMVEAADEDAAHRPAWWNARVVAHERRRFDLAILRVVTDRPLPYEPGQSVAVEAPARPRTWRYYSMANAPRPDNTLDFHVRLVDGGPVSPVLVRALRSGDWLKLRPPVGTMTFDERSGRDVLLVGGLDDLNKRAAENPWFTVVPAVSDEQAEKGAEQGALADVVGRHGLWRDHDAYVCGSPAMVDATVDRLVRLGLGTDCIRADKFADA
jgi:NAD(P)H-flavin reductase/hemoglobin-like flavoprotein